MDRILKLIYRYIHRIDIGYPPLGLQGGKVGVMLFYVLYSELLQLPRLRSKCSILVVEAIDDIPYMEGKLLHGCWGALWALQLLANKMILEIDEEFSKVLQPIKIDYLYSYLNTPIQIIEEDNLFSVGICTYCQWSEEETLERYSTEERLIDLVDECERLLTLTIFDIYTPEEEMTSTLLHSLTHFLTKMKQYGIYPYKTEQTLQKIGKFYQRMEKSSLTDRYILSSLLPEEETQFPSKEDDKTIYNFLAEVEFYSLLYDTPTLFYDVYHRLDKERPDLKKLPDIFGLRYIFVKDTNPIFHRTRYINQMLRETDIKIAAIWDTDAIAPIYQLMKAYRTVLQGGITMVYPYDKHFWYTNDYFTHLFCKKLNIRLLVDYPQPRMLMCGYYSVRGPFLINVQRYKRFGWENEHFAGWGPEDAERYKRMELLGEKPLHVAGSLYHLYHSRGINNSDHDKQLAFQTKKEYCRVCTMYPDELRRYVDTWEWIK